MKPEQYIDSVVAEVVDDELKARLKEELGEHWEDYCEENAMTDKPERVFGNETLVARQTNAVTTPGMLGKDILVSIVCGFTTLFMIVLLSTFLATDVDAQTYVLPTFIASTIGLIFWCSIAWYIYLALHRRMLAHHGQSATRTLMLAVAVAVPLAFSWIESLLGFIYRLTFNAPSSNIWQFTAEILATLILLALFFVAGRLALNNLAATDRALALLRRVAPFVVAFAVIAGVTIILASANANTTTEEVLLLIGTPFMIPIFVLYLLWGASAMGVGFVAQLAGMPMIVGFWITVALALIIGVILPIGQLAFRKKISAPLRFFASVIMPLAVIMPLIAPDVPRVEWQMPVVWSWDTLERQQLNVVYPWAASLMRRDEGVNVSYAAQVKDGQLIVLQRQGYSYRITRDGAENIGMDSEAEKLMQDTDGYGLYNELPAGFACNGTPLEDIADTHNGTTGPLGMFGEGCDSLSYLGTEILVTNHSIIDLDLTGDGLLAVSINMGSYDPTYVYVVDISTIIDN